MTKLNISMPEELLIELDAEARELGLSRSGLIQEASARYIVQAREDRAAERRRLTTLSAARRMHEAGVRLGLAGQDPVELLSQARAADEVTRAR
ncbi:MAG: ribbon-helix-helix protein, CopG family [Coriobacteriia bacterium]|nr:ribbon-helix-helix protein, CopG family [Coriobacteriia bacterium]